MRRLIIIVLIIALTVTQAAAQAPTPPRLRAYLRQTTDGYGIFLVDDPGLRATAWFRSGVNIGFQSYSPNWAPTYRPDGWSPESTVTLCRWFNDDGTRDLALADCTDITMRLVHLPLIIR